MVVGEWSGKAGAGESSWTEHKAVILHPTADVDFESFLPPLPFTSSSGPSVRLSLFLGTQNL